MSQCVLLDVLSLGTLYLVSSHCVKSVRIRSYSGPHFTGFGLNTERYGVSFRIQSESGKMHTRITPNTDTFHAYSYSIFPRSQKQIEFQNYNFDFPIYENYGLCVCFKVPIVNIYSPNKLQKNNKIGDWLYSQYIKPFRATFFNNARTLSPNAKNKVLTNVSTLLKYNIQSLIYLVISKVIVDENVNLTDYASRIRLRIAPNWAYIGKMTKTPQFANMSSSSNFFDVALFLLSSLDTGSSFMTIYPRLTFFQYLETGASQGCQIWYRCL